MNKTSPAARAPVRHAILSVEGFTLRPALRAHAEEKAAKLLRHLHPRVALVRLHVKCERAPAGLATFSVCATAEKTGVDHVAHATSAEPGPAINAVFAKLERVIAAAAGMRKHRRHQSPRG